MAGKAGQRWGERRTAKFQPEGPRVARHHVDPEHAEDALRCRVCGLPGTPDNDVFPGFWRYAARPGIVVNLCERCVWAMTPDELPTASLEDAA